MIELSEFIEVDILNADNFLKIKETLTRIGIASKKEKILYSSCCLLQKQGKYYIVHFKELFALDGKPYNLTANDIQRRNSIANLLEQWGLLKVKTPENYKDYGFAPISQIKVISFSDKKNWSLESKYTVGKKIKK